MSLQAWTKNTFKAGETKRDCLSFMQSLAGKTLVICDETQLSLFGWTEAQCHMELNTDFGFLTIKFLHNRANMEMISGYNVHHVYRLTSVF